MKIYKVWEFHIPSEVFDIGERKKGFKVLTKNNYVVLSSESNKMLSLFDGAVRAKYQIDGIKFASEKISIGDYDLTRFRKIGLDAPWVVHKGNYNRDGIFDSLFGLKLKDDDDKQISFSFYSDDNNVYFTFDAPVSITMKVTSDGKVTIDGNIQKDPLDFKKDTLSIKASKDNKNIYTKTKDDTPYVTLTDSDTSEYFLEYDIKNKTFVKKECSKSDLIVSKYADVLYSISNTPICFNITNFYLSNEEKYVGKEDYSITTGENNIVYSAPKSRLVSASIEYKDKTPIYDYGLFTSTDKLIPMYAYVSRSFVYVEWFRAKASVDPCNLTDDGSLEMVYKLKVKKDKIEVKKDKTGKTVLSDTSSDFAEKYFKALKKGFGVFSNDLFTLKRYKDDGSKVEVKFNYKNSKSYYQIDIYDENTRYKIVETKKVDGDTSQKTYYYYRYRKDPEKELRGTDSAINMYLKEFFDIESDMNTGEVNISSLSVDSLTVSDYANILVVNPLTTKIKFGSLKTSPETFGRTAAVIGGDLKFYKIMYQGISDTIYVVDDSDNKITISDFVKMFNQSTDHYKMEDACAYSQLEYKDASGKDFTVEFPVSTLFLIEPINGAAGMMYRIYYKNSYDIGFFEGTQYKINDL